MRHDTQRRPSAPIGLEKKFAHYKDRVNAYIEMALPSESAPKNLYDPIRYAMAGNGKRLRPILLLLTCEALHGKFEAALPAAAAVELMHNFTLVHDDIMDQDTTRRGRPTVHCKWNSDIALLAGDGLLTLAYRSLLRTSSPNLQRVCQVFTDGIIELCEGQSYDQDFERDDGVTMAQYLDMIKRKTARFFSICTEMGALIAGVSNEKVRWCRQFGESLGMAFQIQDDLLDITVAQEILGKDFGSDIKRRKRTFLYVYVMRRGAPEYRDRLQQIFRKSEITESEVIDAQEIFRNAGALMAAETALREHLQEAHHSLKRLEPSVDTAALHAFLDLVLKRKS
jgi:geranylgeranyl diphosphate synthase type II